MSYAAAFSNPSTRSSRSKKGKTVSKKSSKKGRGKRNPSFVSSLTKDLGHDFKQALALAGGALLVDVVDQNLPASISAGPIGPVIPFVISGLAGFGIKHYAPSSISKFGDSVKEGGFAMAIFRLVAPPVLLHTNLSALMSAPHAGQGLTTGQGETLVRIKENASAFPGSVGQRARGGVGETFLRGLAGGSERAGPPWGRGGPWG